MKRVTAKAFAARVSDLLEDVGDTAVAVTRNGKAIAVLLSVKNEDDLETLVLARSPKFNALLDAAEARIDAGKGIPHDEFWKRVEENNLSEQARRPKRKTG